MKKNLTQRSKLTQDLTEVKHKLHYNFPLINC